MRHRVAVLIALSFVSSPGLRAQQDAFPGWFELAIPGGIATLDALNISAEERAWTLPILARGLQDRDGRVGITPGRLMQTLTATSKIPSDPIVIPVPLDEKTWRQLLPPPTSGSLFTRLVQDRNALLLAVGLMATDASVRTFLARDRDLLRFIYRDAAGAFATVARRLRIVETGVVAPGGKLAETVWQSLAGESPSRAARFIRALLTKDNGRLAWYFDTIAGLDERRLAAAWTAGQTLQSAEELYASFRDPDPQWRLHEQPFRRNLSDAWTLVTQTDVTEGNLASPFPREVWELLFAADRVTPERVTRALQEKTSPVGMSWLARETTGAPMRERRLRFEMFRLAQRVFAAAAPADLPNVAIALNGLREYRALIFTLERMNVSAPATWVAVLDAARHVSNEADDSREAIAAFQAMLALVERIRHVRTIDGTRLDRLLRSLSNAVRIDQRVIRSLSSWIVASLIPELPPLARPDAFTTKTAHESTLLQALAGPVVRPTSRVVWEGLTYTADVVAAEHNRLLAMRALLSSPGLDEALVRERPRDLVEALTALVYATALGEPTGPASLSPDVMSRHDFGFTGTAMARQELPWAPPEERQGVGPWHVQGALLGLDLALSKLALRRVADGEMPGAPTLTLNDLGTLTRTAVLLVPADLLDAERDELAAAVARGRERVRGATDVQALAVLVAECSMPEINRQLLPWIASRQPGAFAHAFSLRDLLWLGQPRLTRVQLDRWGVAADGLDGRRVTAMPPPASWEDYAGRSEAGQMTTQSPDLTLRLVEETAKLKLPAMLIPALLGFALQDYWHDVQARFADDWPQLSRQAAALTSLRIEDYIAALAGDGPLRTRVPER